MVRMSMSVIMVMRVPTMAMVMTATLDITVHAVGRSGGLITRLGVLGQFALSFHR